MNDGRTRTAFQKGFTLIEMSIVLVIIGLIIGGILKGQEIIESSRQKSVITQIDAIRAAVNTFMDRYRELPGDYQFATQRISSDTVRFIAGSGDGIVGTAITAGTAASLEAVAANVENENVQFFSHMIGAKLINGTPALAAGTSTYGEASPLPGTAFPGSGMSVVYGLYADYPAASRTAHWLKIQRGVATTTGGVTPKQMYAMDAKIDDSIPAAGLFRSGLETANCGTLAGTPDYQATNENVECTALIDVIQ